MTNKEVRIHPQQFNSIPRQHIFMGSHLGEDRQGNRRKNGNHCLDVAKPEMTVTYCKTIPARVHSLVLAFWCCETRCVSLTRSLFRDLTDVFLNCHVWIKCL